MNPPSRSDGDARTRRGPGAVVLALQLLPALTVVLLLFGGGLALGYRTSVGLSPRGRFG